MSQSELAKDDDETVLFEVKEFLGDSCNVAVVAGRVSLETYTHGEQTTKSLTGCIHISDSGNQVVWSFYGEHKDRLIEEAASLEKLAAILIDYAAAVRKNVDKLD